jgi:hypothetical protein
LDLAHQSSGNVEGGACQREILGALSVDPWAQLVGAFVSSVLTQVFLNGLAQPAEKVSGNVKETSKLLQRFLCDVCLSGDSFGLPDRATSASEFSKSDSQFE